MALTNWWSFSSKRRNIFKTETLSLADFNFQETHLFSVNVQQADPVSGTANQSSFSQPWVKATRGEWKKRSMELHNYELHVMMTGTVNKEPV